MLEKDASVVKENVGHGDSSFVTRAVLRLCARWGATCKKWLGRDGVNAKSGMRLELTDCRCQVVASVQQIGRAHV